MPLQYPGVMVSSTFSDLKEHRAALMEALHRQELFAIGMEGYVPEPGDNVPSSSLEMVRKGSAFIGLISHRYGQIPARELVNPHGYSISQLEFEEAQALGRPTLIFVMGEDHPGKRADFESDSEKIEKLEAFRERAKTGRIYVVFESLEDFTREAIHAVARLRECLELNSQAPTENTIGPSRPVSGGTGLSHVPSVRATLSYEPTRLELQQLPAPNVQTANRKDSAPLLFKGVTISSTLTDLAEHRSSLITMIKRQGLTEIAMENSSARPDSDVLDSSLQMVRDGSAYIGLIGRRYGQTPKCPRRNPQGLSMTELEFNEAQRLGRPILLFLMGDEHRVREVDVEANPTRRKKLKAFRERAKQMTTGSIVHRVYAVFESLDEFKEQASAALGLLRRYLD